MKRLSLGLAALGVLLTVAACGGTSTATGTAGSGGSPVIATSTTAPGTPPISTSVNPSSVAGLAHIYLPATQITSDGTNAPSQVQVAGGSYLLFNAEQSGCETVSGQVVSQTASQVVVNVVTTSTKKGNQMCPMYIRNVQLVVELSAPLGHRTVVFHSVRQPG